MLQPYILPFTSYPLLFLRVLLADFFSILLERR